MFDTLIKHSKDREKLDFYATDQRAITELLKRERFREQIYEPACGEGHIGKVLEEHNYKVKAEDICYRGYGSEKEVDFFTVQENHLDIVTNPPYFCAEAFLKHALEISREQVKIAMLFRRKGCEQKRARARAGGWYRLQDMRRLCRGGLFAAGWCVGQGPVNKGWSKRIVLIVAGQGLGN